MRYFRLFLFIYIGFIISSLLIFYFGNEGVAEYKKLRNYKTELRNNLEELKQINHELGDELELLKRDPDINKVEARRLGLISDGERLVKIEGYDNRGQSYEVGRLFSWDIRKDNRNLIFKYIGIFIPLFLIVIFGLIGFLKKINGNGS